MLNKTLTFFILLLLNTNIFACSLGTTVKNGFYLPTMSLVTKKINVYEASAVSSQINIQDVKTSTVDITRIFDACSVKPQTKKTLYGNVNSANVTPFLGNIYRLNNTPALGVKVEVADSPSAQPFYEVGTSETAIYQYDGDSHGARVRVTIYILPRTNSMSAYPSNNIQINNLHIADITLRTTSTGAIVASKIPVYFNANITIQQTTCALSQSSYTLNLPDTNMRQLGMIGEGTSLTTGNTITLNINCADLVNGGGREVKAYITDALNQTNASNVLQNTVGNNYATGIGIRLQDNNNNIINFDPNQTKTVNKWTFGNLNTSQNVQHIIKANYVRTSTKVTAGLVRSMAYLNIVYD
jgi:hypothetical protein